MTTDTVANRHYVTDEDLLEEGQRVIREISGREVAVFNIDDEYYAIGNYCPHMGGPCAEGVVMGFFSRDDSDNLTYTEERKVVSCPWHGWEFDIATGEELAYSKKRLLTYDVAVEGGSIYVIV